MSLGDEIAAHFFSSDDPAHKMVVDLFAAHEEGDLSLYVGERIPETLRRAMSEGAPFVFSHGYLYLLRDFQQESRFVETLHALQEEARQEGLVAFDFKDRALTPSQQTAVVGLFSNALEILTGGPGTGKTFVAAASIRAYLSKYKESRLVIAAPTGKATANLRKHFIDHPKVCSMTLHRLLMEATRAGGIAQELIVIDEASMVDFAQMETLFRLRRKGSRILLIGDPYQLPPVERGFIFRDLTKIVATRTLTECLRAEVKEIYYLAEAVRKQDVERFFALLEENPKSLHFSETFSSAMAPPYLCATKRGPWGVETLNRLCVEREKRGGRFPILVTKNMPSLGLANGDIGELEMVEARAQKRGQKASFRDRAYFGSRSFPANLLCDYDFAYAISVHKSQGSEADSPTVLFGEGAERSDRALLYTAITRAKKGLTLVAERALLEALLTKPEPPPSGFLARFST